MRRDGGIQGGQGGACAGPDGLYARPMSDDPDSSATPPCELLRDGATAYARMLELIDGARQCVDLEIYIFRADAVGDRFRLALTAAAIRGVRVRVLVDAFGSQDLPADYFASLEDAGGAVRRFNPRRLLRPSFRNHRKLLRCDSAAVVGGLNIADEYEGDGVRRGWRDLALLVRGPVVTDLCASFERMWTLAPFGRRDVRAFWKTRTGRRPQAAPSAPLVLCAGAGWPTSELRGWLIRDIRSSRQCLAWVAYFLPSRRLGRAMRQTARTGEVRLLLGRRTDVPIARWAGERHFGRFLRARAALYEYEPQIVHAKALVADDVVYMGSANLDVRSLRINYELLLRLPDARLAAELRQVFTRDLGHSRELTREEWRRSRRWWHPVRSWFAHLLLARLDPYVASRRLDTLR